MKVIIENIVARMEGKEEKELPRNTTIRFEIGKIELSCKITKDGLEIYKTDNSVERDSRIIIMSVTSNKINIK